MADRSQTEALFGKTLNPDGTLRAVSPSQVIAFQRCGLRWHFDKKGRLQKKPMGKGADKGDKAHGRMETFLNTGQDVRGPLELVGAKMIEPYLWAAPFRKGPGLVEGPLLEPRLATPGGVLITGYFDYYVPGGYGETGLSWPVIIDHKFKKKLIQWGYYTDEAFAEFVGAERVAADEEKLKNDPQTLVYGGWALTRQPEADGVVVRHHQHQTEGEGGMFPLPAEVRLTRDDLLRRWGALAAVIDGPMVAASRVPAAMPGETPDGVPYNDMACGDFGGCDFARTCKHSPMNKFTALLRTSGQPVTRREVSPHYTEVNPMGLLNQINAPATSTPAVASTPQTEGAMVAALTASLTEIPVSKAVAGTLYLIPPTASPAKFEGAIGSRAIFRDKAGGLREVAADATVRTTDEETLCMFEGRPFAKPTPAVAATPQPTAPTIDEAKAERARKLGIVYVDEKPPAGGVVPPDVAKPPEVVATVTTAEAIATKTNAIEATAPGAALAAEPKKRGKKADALSVPVGTIQEVEGADGSAKLFLLINCSCNRAQDLAGYVKGLCDAVATAGGAPDVRLGHKNSDLGFGGWKGLLAMAAVKAPPSGLCSIQSSELADPIIEALIPLAAVVVRGGVR